LLAFFRIHFESTGTFLKPFYFVGFMPYHAIVLL
jgi:hypothetical protein